MLRPAFACAALALLAAPLSTAAEERCIVCAGGGAQSSGRPRTIEFTTNHQFSPQAMTGAAPGDVEIDPQTGSRKIGGGLIGLGGVPFQGRGRITGSPMRPVRVDLPGRIAMTTSTGGKAELTDLTTDLPAFPMLDATGTLEFSFGGRLKVSDAAGGTFRARIPISVDYN
jgi:hypothetical protein